MPRYKRCPECGCRDAKKVGFTWWGGLLGPSLLTHVECLDCGTCFNGKTGRSNTTGIIIYTIVTAVIAFGLLGLVVALKFIL
jgi:hypothetical protein